VIYTEAILEEHSERLSAKEKGNTLLSYPQAVAEISDNYELISIAGTHGKSTTTALLSLSLIHI
jgi:UDP-N-acetylmuramate--alanine ligase